LRIALCNEVIAALPFERQCVLAAELGYDGLEVAPMTLSDDPRRIDAKQLAAVRAAAKNAGIVITGLHYLLLKPDGLSITTDDKAAYTNTIDVMRRLIELCAELGGKVLVHGSPAQRKLPDGAAAEAARERGEAAFATIAEDAQKAGVTYCVEPLNAKQTNFINTLEEAAALIRRVGSSALKTMIDCSAAAVAEAEPIPDLITRWHPTGLLAHVQVNDRNRRGPGQGQDRFAPVFAALKKTGYDGVVSVEPFDYVPDGIGSAARAIGYIRGILETL
jgi:sugar phosphate isomerase/epimerase